MCATQSVVGELMIESRFDLLIDTLQNGSSSSDVFCEIIHILETQNSDRIASFISQYYSSLFILEQWVWQLLGEEFSRWINQLNCIKLFETLKTFNKSLIFDYDNIEVSAKASFLIPERKHYIDRILEHIEQIEDTNHLVINLSSVWLDNLSYFLRENPQFEQSTVIDHLNRHLAHYYVMTDQYKSYLIELRQTQLSQSVFTAKTLFYIKTCSLSLSTYLFAKAQDFLYTPDQIIDHFGVDYIRLFLHHTYTIDSWTSPLLACITYLTVLFSACCWWGGDKGIQAQVVFHTKSTACEYIDALIRIINCKKISQCITTQRSNDQTILLDITIFSMISIAQNQDFIWFLRSKTTLSETLLNIAETSICEKISLCIYGVLGEILSDEHLKELKISDNVSLFFFNMLEQAWHHPSKNFKQIPIYYLLKGFVSLSKFDIIQQKTAETNKVSLLIEMCEQYPIVFDILWALSFNEDIQQQLRFNTCFMTQLVDRSNRCDNEQILKSVHGILWNLESNHDDRMTTMIDINDKKLFDIMISYSHKDEVICRRIYDQLIKVGYRVWIDFDQMHGNIMDAMAKAIEQSKTILICMSEQYRRSNYCRAEAHYAFQRQLKLVPILVQEHYQPDGWLLFLIGQLLYIDFSKYDFLQAFQMLIRELKASIIDEINTISICFKDESDLVTPTTLIPLQRCSLSTLPENILTWNQIQVHDWLINHHLLQMSRLFTNFDGRSLMYMHEVIENVELQQVVTLLREDCLRQTGQNLSLVEFSKFRSLIQQQAQRLKPVTTMRVKMKDFNKLKTCVLTHCQIM